jgi:hypothetical protein
MNREDIIRMYEKANGWSPEGWDKTVDELERFAALVAAAEREACAKVCEHFLSSKENDDAWTITRDLALQAAADVIRERGAP